jgi:hypothetical protein
MVSEAVRLAASEWPVPKDGKDVDPVFVEKMVHASVAAAVAAIPKPQDGAPGEAGRDADPEFIRSSIIEASASLNREVLDMAEEILHGLDDVSDGGSKARNYGAMSRDQAKLVDTIEEIFMRPVKPVYDDSGRLLYGQRVMPEEVAGALHD